MNGLILSSRLAGVQLTKGRIIQHFSNKVEYRDGTDTSDIFLRPEIIVVLTHTSISLQLCGVIALHNCHNMFHNYLNI